MESRLKNPPNTDNNSKSGHQIKVEPLHILPFSLKPNEHLIIYMNLIILHNETNMSINMSISLK